MTDETDASKTSSEAEKAAATAEKTDKKAKNAKVPLSDKEKRQVRILTVCLVLAIVAFIYQVIHANQVIKEAADPHSPNAELGRHQAMEKDEIMFQARPVLPLKTDSAVMHERDDVVKGTGINKTSKPEKAPGAR